MNIDEISGPAASAFGLNNMFGNELEWVEDCRNGIYDSVLDDGSAWVRETCLERVHRTVTGSCTRAVSIPRTAEVPDADAYFVRATEDST